VRKTFFYELWDEPLVCVISAGASLQDGLDLALAHAAGRPCHILARPSWDLADIGPEIAEAVARLRTPHPNANLTCVAPTEADAAMMAALGVEAVHASNAAFIDERLFRPHPGAAKLFDAVHNAQTKDFKRHHLAACLPRLALITYDEQGSSEAIGAVAGQYRDLRFVNWTPEAGYRSLDAGQINRVVGQSCCGLILSEVEGANNASMEYRLCGIPHVTTPSRGGREALYDPDFVTVVEPDPQAVEAAVAGWVRHPPDPEAVRAAALAAARPHRARLIAWLSQVVGRDLMSEAADNLWLPQFHDKLRQTWRYEIGVGGALHRERITGWVG